MDFAEWLARTCELSTETVSGEWMEAPLLDNNNDNDVYRRYPAAPSASPVSTMHLNIDPMLAMNDVVTNNASIPTNPPTITVSNPLIETSREILLFLLKTLNVSNNNANEQSINRFEFTDLESIPESSHDSSLPRIINDIRITSEPHTNQIDHIIDCKRAGTKHRMFYLARTTKENYYWFCGPRTDRDLKLNRLIEDYQYKLRPKKGNKKIRVGKKLRNGKTIMI